MDAQKIAQKEQTLQAMDLAVGYDRRIVLDQVSFSVKAGEILVLIGPNGAGKSTVLKTLAGQLQKLGGLVRLEDRKLEELKAREVARKLAILMTERPGAELMTVEDMVETGRYPYTGYMGILSRQDHEAVETALELVGLQDIRDQEFDRLSDGQKQRALLARAISQEPRVLILDEPTSYLDMHHKVELLSILKKLVREQRLAVVMSLHELDLAQKCADALLCIGRGWVDRYGSPEEIFTEDGDYIRTLYGMDKGSFLSAFGSIELDRPTDGELLFVIGGGGAGIPIYRRLQRHNRLFAAGVLQENDLEFPVAGALASQVVSVGAFEEVDETALQQAMALIDVSSGVIEAVSRYGSCNKANKRLAEYAAKQGKLLSAGEI